MSAETNTETVESYPVKQKHDAGTPLHLPRPSLRSRPILREVIDTVIFIVVVYVLVEMAAPRFLVEGPSMQPTFWDNQRLIISRLHYILSDPERGDIVVFNKPGSGLGAPPLIKRAIGLPGDTIEFRQVEQTGNGLATTALFINGEQVDEPYINEPCRPGNCNVNKWVLGPDEYFVMGDNRNHSSDSRSFDQMIKKSDIIGEALIRYWPPDAWALLKQIRYTGP
jgi:signal peptidase I